MKLVFSARMTDLDRKPVKGVSGLLRAYSIKDGEWVAIAEFETDGDGSFGGEADLSNFDDALPLLSLQSGSAAFSGPAPTVKVDSGRRVVQVQFGQVVMSNDESPTKPVVELSHIGIDQLVTGLGAKLGDAGLSLGETTQGRLRLGNVKVQVRGVVGNDGLGMALNDPKATAAAGSVLEVEYEQETDAPEVVTRTVPSLIGTTSTLSRRILTSVGLRMNASSKTATGDDTIGQCVLQSPEPGTEAPVGTEVLVVFAT